jgi:hypothetical protein
MFAGTGVFRFNILRCLIAYLVFVVYIILY